MENHIFFFQMSWKDGLSKKNALEYDSCIIEKDDIFYAFYDFLFFFYFLFFIYDIFFPENMILHLRQKMEDDLS